MDGEKTVRFGYSSYTNISFWGTLDTGIPRSEWDEMSAKNQNQVTDELIYDLVELFELNDDEPDYYGR